MLLLCYLYILSFLSLINYYITCIKFCGVHNVFAYARAAIYIHVDYWTSENNGSSLVVKRKFHDEGKKFLSTKIVMLKSKYHNKITQLTLSLFLSPRECHYKITQPIPNTQRERKERTKL